MSTVCPSPNFDPRPNGTPLDMLVLHYTGMETAEHARSRLCDPEAKVSAHYLIDTDGHIDQLVDEAHRAWHAGVASWRRNVDINARSIGIELVNPGHEHGYRPFPSRQMAALLELAGDIVARHSIPQCNVVGHSDVAPTRKLDPGELFDWRGLAQAGLGLWFEDLSDIKAIDPGEAIQDLATFGYDITDEKAATRAFQRHFRPWRISGCMDGETAACLAGLLRRS